MKFGCFNRVKIRVGCAQFAELPPRMVMCQGKLRVFARGDDQVNLWRQSFEQKRNDIVNRFGINHMLVVKDKHKMLGCNGNFVESGGQNCFDL
jgi:hypothetical protein